MGAMCLDRFFGHPELATDLFVEQSRSYELHHFVFAPRQPSKQRERMISFGCAKKLFDRTSEGAVNAFQQLLRHEWLWKKVDGACFHCLGAHWNIAVRGYENELLFAAMFDQGFLKSDSIQPGHPHINNDARRSLIRRTREKLGPRLEHLSLVMSSV